MRNYTRLFVSPNRENLKFVVEKVSKETMLEELDWIIELVKEKGLEIPKIIIFCSTLYAIGSVVNYMMLKLNKLAFYPTSSKEMEHCIVGIYHSSTLPKYKERVLNSFKSNGTKRIAVATTALSMGVNFPDVRYVVMYGPPRSILDFHQEAGRAGRDGTNSYVILSYYGQQITHCEDDMRMFLKSTGCRRVAAYSSLDQEISPKLPGHECCDYCSSTCECDHDICNQPKPYERKQVVETKEVPSRTVSETEKKALEESLKELQTSLSSNTGISAFGSTSSHGFSSELISDVVNNCPQDIYT